MATRSQTRSGLSRFATIAIILLILAFVAIGGFIGIRCFRPERYAATALFNVSSEIPSVLGDRRPFDAHESDVLHRTQLAYLKSQYVIGAALRKPDIASLSILAAPADKVQWVTDNLDVSFPQQSEILQIKMNGSEDQTEDLRKLVDAISSAYQKEVVFVDDQRRLARRDSLAKSLGKLSDEIITKMGAYNAMAKDLDISDSDRGRILQQLDIKRLDHIEAELMRLEDAALRLDMHAETDKQSTSEQSTEAEFYKRRIEELTKRQMELQERIEARRDVSAELTVKRQELDLLQQIAKELSMKLETLDIEASAPPRIRLLQPAVIGTASDSAASGGSAPNN